MDDPAIRKGETRRRLRVTRGTPAEGAAGSSQLRVAGGPVYGSVDTAAPCEGGIRGVYDRIDSFFGDVPGRRFDPHPHLIRSPRYQILRKKSTIPLALGLWEDEYHINVVTNVVSLGRATTTFTD
jgi:hypothetical protein